MILISNVLGEKSLAINSCLITEINLDSKSEHCSRNWIKTSWMSLFCPTRSNYLRICFPKSKAFAKSSQPVLTWGAPLSWRFVFFDSSFWSLTMQYIFHHLRVIYTALFQRKLSSGALICPILRRVSRIIWERGVSQSWSRSVLVASSSSTPLLPIGIVPEVDHLQSVNSERHTMLTVLSANISIQSMIEGTNDTLILSTSLQTV